jgi:hypothetical protein
VRRQKHLLFPILFRYYYSAEILPLAFSWQSRWIHLLGYQGLEVVNSRDFVVLHGWRYERTHTLLDSVIAYNYKLPRITFNKSLFIWSVQTMQRVLLNCMYTTLDYAQTGLIAAVFFFKVSSNFCHMNPRD